MQLDFIGGLDPGIAFTWFNIVKLSITSMCLLILMHKQDGTTHLYIYIYILYSMLQALAEVCALLSVFYMMFIYAFLSILSRCCMPKIWTNEALLLRRPSRWVKNIR